MRQADSVRTGTVPDDGLDRLMKNQIPVVSVDDCNRPGPISASDYENGTRILTEEALRRGRRRLARLQSTSVRALVSFGLALLCRFGRLNFFLSIAFVSLGIAYKSFARGKR